MLEGKVRRVALLSLVLFISACSQTQPKVKKEKSSCNQAQPEAKKEKSSCVQVQPKVKKEAFVCIQPQPQPEVKEVETIIYEPEVLEEQSNLTELSLYREPIVMEEENWVPLSVEDEIEWNAKELLGHKYVWGATGPVTYDCSGFTRKIFSDVGIYLPRVSRDQSKQGQLVAFDELQKGDLVFFATKRRHPNRVTHVGIYLGNGDFIHASSAAKKVVICNFDKHCFYKKHFLWARRVISDKQRFARTGNSFKKAEKSL